MSGVLYVVGTPIGNLEDITLRALRILREVDLVAAEDTRHSRKLLSHYNIHVPMAALHGHNEIRRIEEILRRIGQGETVALITDAGTPVVSDPGAHLIAAAAQAGVRVIPVPGPSAVVAAVSAAGLPAARFVFEGFLPRRGRDRRRALAYITSEERAVVLFEAPHRIFETLVDLTTYIGARQLAVARELTKQFEEVRRGTAMELLSHFEQHRPQGEFTIVISAAERSAEPMGHECRPTQDRSPGTDNDEGAKPAEQWVVALRELEQRGVDRRQALKQVALTAGVPRRTVYEAVLVDSRRKMRDQ